MKPIIILCGILFAVILAFLAWKSSAGEDHHGKPFTAGLGGAPIADVVANPESYLGKPVTLQGVLKRQCPATGCWFFLSDPADPAAKELKVEMGDTTPRLPRRLGRTARVEGQLIRYGDGYEFIGVAVTFEKEPGA